MIDNTKTRSQTTYFDLPLHFGFGKDFHGFKGAEYDSVSAEASYLYVIGHTDQHPESPLHAHSIQVYPTNSDSPEVRELIYQWLKDTLASTQSMEDWLHVCFRGDGVEWIRRLLRTVWQYSIQSWNEHSHPQSDDSQLDGDLLRAWIVALLITMQSLPITIPKSARQGVLSKLESVRPDHTYSFSSRPINKYVKGLFFEFYNHLIMKITSSLDAFKRMPLKNISERYLGHIHCMTVLIIVITSRLQTSLMDNYRLSAQDNADLLEKTFYHIREVEKAFKNTVLYVWYRNRELFKWRRHGKGNRGDDDIPLIPPRLQGIIDIKRAYIEGLFLWFLVCLSFDLHITEISRHRTVKLESVLDLKLPFHLLNMQRVFAFYFDSIPPEGNRR